MQDNSDDDEALDKAYAALPVAKKKEEGKREYTDATVWIGILADTLGYVRALEMLGRIRSFINNVSSVKVNIAFRLLQDRNYPRPHSRSSCTSVLTFPPSSSIPRMVCSSSVA